jgi:hypothetical protein
MCFPYMVIIAYFVYVKLHGHGIIKMYVFIVTLWEAGFPPHGDTLELVAANLVCALPSPLRTLLVSALLLCAPSIYLCAPSPFYAGPSFNHACPLSSVLAIISFVSALPSPKHALYSCFHF